MEWTEEGFLLVLNRSLIDFVRVSVVDPNTLNLDPDPGFWPNPDPDPGLYLVHYQL